MAFTLEQVLSKIGTPEYLGIDNLIRRVKETSAEIHNAAPNVTTLSIQGKAHVNLTPTHMNSDFEANKPEIKRMAFINEKIPEQDRAKFESVINYQNLKKQARYISEFHPNSHLWWTIDRERGVYILGVVGGGRDQLNYYALVINGQAIVFNEDHKTKGNDSTGLEYHWDIYDLRIPAELELQREEIKQLIREGLEERAYCRPYANGGTAYNPNTTARGNLISFEVEFK